MPRPEEGGDAVQAGLRTRYMLVRRRWEYYPISNDSSVVTQKNERMVLKEGGAASIDTEETSATRG